MQLSPHFSLQEMTRTEHRHFLHTNIPNDDERQKLVKLCELLEHVRAQFGPVVIHSGFRSKELNKSIGGASTSQHVKGEAADFHVINHTLDEIWAWIVRDSGLQYGQCIREPGWIHLSLGAPYRPEAKCQQALTYDGSRYTIVEPSTLS